MEKNSKDILLLGCLFISGAAFGFAANGIIGSSIGIGIVSTFIAFILFD
jgi:hypothetical protein